MAAEATRADRRRAPTARATLDAFAEAGAALAEEATLGGALRRVAGALAAAVGASVAVVRVREEDALVARAVVTDSRVLAALLEGSTVPVDSVGDGERRSAVLEAAAAAAAADVSLALPVLVGDDVVGSIELLRGDGPFSAAERSLAEVLATHVAVAIGKLPADGADGAGLRDETLELAGEALAAATDERGAAEELVRLAVRATPAHGSVLWRGDGVDTFEQLAAYGDLEHFEASEATSVGARALGGRPSLSLDRVGAGAHRATLVTLPLGRPARWVLQLVQEEEPTAEELARLATFGVRGLHALRAADRARTLQLELERARALLTLAAKANEQLSLSHTLETVVERIAELLESEQLGVYLRDRGRLIPAAGRAVAGSHVPVAERLLELALGPFRGRGVLVIDDAATDPRFDGLGDELEDAGIAAAVAVPLVVPDEVIGLLAVYPPSGRMPSAHEIALLTALAAQLAVSVQNAKLHEQATQLGSELEGVLAAERQAARHLKALYEISRSFAQSLSLDATLEAAVKTIVELLDVDAAVIRMPDARGELLVPRALHVAEPRLTEAVGTVLSRPQPLDKLPGRRLLRRGQPLVLDAEAAASLKAGHELLVPFLEKGSTAAEVPIATPTELLGTIGLLSLDRERPLDDETVAVALSVATQAALAIDNARLYQSQKQFADTMQRSLLPRSQPELAGMEVGDVYESSARVEVGGDVYDFLTLDDGRLAVVLGDVTGHGIDAAADMAMAKFVFRSLAREHSEPADFLAAANRVVCDEIAAGKFITMLYLTVDGARGELACASAGHPRPRVVLPDGSVRPIEVGGLALGIDPDQAYEEVREPIPPGASVVVYTDGVVEARRDGELYGSERLDRVLSEQRHLPAGELARAVLAECRAHSRGELADDCALVVIKRTGD